MSKNIFKSLNLERDKLYDWILEFCEQNFGEYSVGEICNVSGNLYRCEFTGDDKTALIDFYYNTNGTTTIQPRVGTNQDISIRLATAMLDQIEYRGQSILGSSYSITPLEQEDFKFIIEYLSDLEGVKQINYSENANNKYQLYQFQGKPMHLYQEVTCKQRKC